MSDINVKRRRKLRRRAIAVALTPAVMLPFAVAYLISDPAAIIRDWNVVLILFGIPFAVAALMWWYAGRQMH